MIPHFSTLLSLLLLLGTPLFASAAEKPWFQRSLVGMEIGPTGANEATEAMQLLGTTNDLRYASRFDGREIVRRCVEAHGEYVVIWARDSEWAYYDSKLEPKAPGLGKRDVLRETVDEARQHNLPVLTYILQQYPARTLIEHPDWKALDRGGTPINDRVCYNSPYLDYMKQMIAEQLAYGIDGFHLDMLDQGFGGPPWGCCCERCQKLFQAEYGRPMPEGITWDEDWDRVLEFRYATSMRYEQALTRYVKELNPRATVDFNYHGNPPFSFWTGQRPVQHARNGDFNTGETGVHFSWLTVSLTAEFYRAATPGLPFQVAMQRGVRKYHDQTTRPLNDMRWELLNLLAHGAFVTMIDKRAYDGSFDPVAYERIGAAFKEAHDKRAHFGQAPVQEVGIYFSSRTRDWYGRNNPENYFQSFQGAHKALVYEHIPWGVLLEENVTLEGLKVFPVVMLPNVAILSSNEVALLRRYVEDGGNLLVTGLSGCYDRLGNLAKENAIADLIGAKFARQLDTLDNWVRFGGGAPASPDAREPSARARSAAGGAPALLPLLHNLRPDWLFLVRGPAAIYEPTTATPVGELWKPARNPRQLLGKETTANPMSADTAVGPAILINSLGKGTVLTFTGSPDFATAGEYYIVEARRLLCNAVRFLNPKPLVKITAPANVEAVVTDDPAKRTLRVHLLGYNSPPQTLPARNWPYVVPVPIEDAPMYRVTVEVNRPIKRATGLNKSTGLERRGNRVEATVDDIHEVLVIRY